jgi:hypothetical protein
MFEIVKFLIFLILILLIYNKNKNKNMYSKPEVRVIQNQQVDTTPAEVTSSEAAALLAKYGYSSNTYNNQPQTSVPDNGLTVQDLYAQYDREMELKKQREMQRRYGPKAYTFDNNNVNYSNTDYKSLDIEGHNLGIQVQVVSDMPIYNNRRY